MAITTRTALNKTTIELKPWLQRRKTPWNNPQRIQTESNLALQPEREGRCKKSKVPGKRNWDAPEQGTAKEGKEWVIYLLWRKK